MPTLPWMTPENQQPRTDDYLVFGSRFVVSSPLWSAKFMWGTLRLVNQMRHAKGCVGLSLKAEVLKGRFWTVSVWHDPAMLGEFARSEPHRTIAAGLAASMKESTFNSWKIAPDHQLPLPWSYTQEQILRQQ